MRDLTCLIDVSVLQIEDSPNGVGFMFEPKDGAKMNAQQILDALADFLLSNDEDLFLDREQKDMH